VEFILLDYRLNLLHLFLSELRFYTFLKFLILEIYLIDKLYMIKLLKNRYFFQLVDNDYNLINNAHIILISSLGQDYLFSMQQPTSLLGLHL
jgi:hypothetical protein